MSVGDNGVRTRGLSHAKRALYHWAISPCTYMYFIDFSNCLWMFPSEFASPPKISVRPPSSIHSSPGRFRHNTKKDLPNENAGVGFRAGRAESNSKTKRVATRIDQKNVSVEITGFEPVASRMQSERSTTELYPLARSVLHHWLISLLFFNFMSISLQFWANDYKYCNPGNVRKRLIFALFVNFWKFNMNINSLLLNFQDLKCAVKNSQLWKLELIIL